MPLQIQLRRGLLDDAQRLAVLATQVWLHTYAVEGISDLTAPINALVGVFLDDEQPNHSAPPKALDFRSPASREFTSLEPQLKQLFWIGDGKTKDGLAQEFAVPEGATRLYLATWDFYEWNNNAGWRVVNRSSWETSNWSSASWPSGRIPRACRSPMPYTPILATLGYVFSPDGRRVLLVHRVVCARQHMAIVGEDAG